MKRFDNPDYKVTSNSTKSSFKPYKEKGMKISVHE
jgi:hypothetical protein